MNSESVPKIVNFDEMPFEQLSDKIFRRYVYGVNGMLVYFKLLKDGVIKKHHHVSEQITYIIEGKVRVLAANKEFLVSKGQVLIIPPNVEHEFHALEDTMDIDVFSPIRHDWLSGEESYLK